MDIHKKSFCGIAVFAICVSAWFASTRLVLPSKGASEGCAWLPFDSKEVARCLDAGDLILIFGNPLYDLEGAAFGEFFDDPDVGALLRRKEIVCFYLQYDELYDDDVQALFGFTRRMKEPVVAIIQKDQKTKYFDFGTKNHLLKFVREQ